MDIKNNKVVAIGGVVVIVGSVLFSLWSSMSEKAENERIEQEFKKSAIGNPGEDNIPYGPGDIPIIKAPSAGAAVAAAKPVPPIPVAPVQNTTEQQPVAQQPALVQEPQDDISAELYPFLTEQERRDYLNVDTIQPLPSYAVSAIVYSPSKAVINGQIVKEGDTIDTFTVLRIKKESVILSDRKSLYNVRLKKVGE